MEIYFPEDFQNHEQQSQNVLKIKLINTMLDGIINKEDEEVTGKKVFSLEKEILQTVKPNIWNIHVEGNMEQKLEVDFRLYAISVVDSLGLKLEEINVFDFYTSIQYLKNKFKKK